VTSSETAAQVHTPVTLEELAEARQRIAGSVLRTPLVRLSLDDAPAEIYLKLENLQPIGAFKLRGAANRILRASPDELAQGVWTVSSGNMAQGVAWCARELGIPCTVVVPADGTQAKVAAAERLGAEVVRVSRDVFYDILGRRRHDGLRGLFVHPFSDRDVIAGNGTVGLEIVEDLPDVDTVLVGYGGGGLSCGVASALRAVAPRSRVVACEPDSAAPLASAWRAGRPVPSAFTRTFIDGVGGVRLFPEMWDLARILFSDAVTVPVSEVAAAVRLLAVHNAIVAEGAGALPVAAALRGSGGSGKVCCVVSGGNIEPGTLATILSSGRPPGAGPEPPE
jgi:threonine dehydratase